MNIITEFLEKKTIAKFFEKQYIANFDNTSNTVLQYDMKNAITIVDNLSTVENYYICYLINNGLYCELDEPNSEYWLLVGLYYFDIDKLLSKQYLEKCYLQNNPTANIFLGLLETHLGNGNEGHDYFMSGAKASDICFGFCSEHTIVNYIWKNDLTRFDNAKITIEKLKNAAEKGCNRACYNLGFMHERHCEGCYSYKKVIKYYNLAITKNFNCYKSLGSLNTLVLWNEYLKKKSNEEIIKKVENVLIYLRTPSVRNFSYTSNIEIDIACCFCMLQRYDDSLLIYRKYIKCLNYNQTYCYIYCLVQNKEYFEAEKLCANNFASILCNEYLKTNNHRKVNFILEHNNILNKNEVNEWLKNVGYHYKIIY